MVRDGKYGRRVIMVRDGKHGRRVNGRYFLRKDFVEFSNKLYHFKQANLEIFLVNYHHSAYLIIV